MPDVPVTPMTRSALRRTAVDRGRHARRAPRAAPDAPAPARRASQPSTCRARRVGEHRDRAARDGVGGVRRAVRRRPGQRREQVTGQRVLARSVTPVTTHGRHLDRLRRPPRPTCAASSASGTPAVDWGRSGVDTDHHLRPAVLTPYRPCALPSGGYRAARSAVRTPAGSAADPGRATAARSRAAATRPRCCGTAAPPTCPAGRRRVRCGLSIMMPTT